MARSSRSNQSKSKRRSGDRSSHNSSQSSEPHVQPSRKVHYRLGVLLAENYMGKRIKQTQLAAATGISTRTLSRIVNNQVRVVDSITIELLCEYFRCEIQDLMVLQEEQLAAPESEDADDSDSDKLRIAQSIEPAPDSSSQFIRSQDDTSNESSAEK